MYYRYPPPEYQEPTNPKYQIFYKIGDADSPHKTFDTEEKAIEYCNWLNKEYSYFKMNYFVRSID